MQKRRYCLAIALPSGQISTEVAFHTNQYKHSLQLARKPISAAASHIKSFYQITLRVRITRQSIPSTPSTAQIPAVAQICNG